MSSESGAYEDTRKSRTTHLRLVPCNCYWLAVQYNASTVIAICKKCRKRGIFTATEWQQMKQDGEALDKPVRI